MSEDDMQAAGEQKALIALLSSEPSEPESNLQADVSINVIVAWLLGIKHTLCIWGLLCRRKPTSGTS